MIAYKIVWRGKRHPVPEVLFAEGKYALAAEFLLAEARSFGDTILQILDDVCQGRSATGEFTGNAFSLAISPELTRISDELSGREGEIPTPELRKITADYKRCWENPPA